MRCKAYRGFESLSLRQFVIIRGMNDLQIGLLLVAGFAGGVVNSIAGGGTFIIYPLLLSFGIPPVIANATCTPVVFFGQITSALGYHKYVRKLPKRYYLLLFPFVIGALVGAVLLAKTSNRQFEYVVPWFIAFATLLILFQPQLHKWLYGKKGRSFEHKHSTAFNVIITLSIFLLAVYGGYFGAGYGIVMLGLLGLSKLSDIHQMNGLKNLGGIAMTIVASAYFIHAGIIAWEVVPALAIGNAIGGWLGATYSTRLPTKLIRGIIIGIGITVAAALFLRLHN